MDHERFFLYAGYCFLLNLATLSAKTMKRIQIFLFTTILFTIFSNDRVRAQEQKNGLTWYTDINQAYDISNKAQKPIFAFFTGSDWCVWCHRLEHNVFEKPGFKEWARKNVVLLELDFPRKKKLPEKLANQNNGLQQFFKIQGYPTVWMFYLKKDKDKGDKFNVQPLGSLGYPESEAGKEEVTFIDQANQVLKNKKP
jgi:thioredoxin-related protein